MKESLKNKFVRLISKKDSQRISFKNQTVQFWEEFEVKESSIRQLMIDKADRNTLVAAMNEVLSIAFNDVPFEMGINDKNKHELILSPNGNRIKLMQITYLLKLKPKHLDMHWNFYSTKPASDTERIGLSIYGIQIEEEDFLIYTDLHKEKKVIHMEVFIPKLSGLDENNKYNALFIMLDLSIGELYTMEYVGQIKIIDYKKEDNTESIPLSKMKAYIDYLINEHDWVKNENIIETYSAYKANGLQNAKELRKDVHVGYSSCFEIIRELGEKDIYPISELEKDGVYMGYIYYDNSSVPNEKVVETRTNIEEEIMDIIKDKGIADCIGGATGYNNSYIDFMIYDFDAFIEVAKEVVSEQKYPKKGFAFFQTSAPIILF